MHIQDLLDLTVREGASDLLLSAGAPPMMRLDGQLTPCSKTVLNPEQTMRVIFSLLTDKQRARFEERKELDFSLAVGEKERFRVNVYYQKQAVTAAFRPISDRIPAIETLGLPPSAVALASARQGLVLVTGPTGHGKTTTQAALIDRINQTRACHVITIEDPIEFVHHHQKSIVDQREVESDTLGFADALKYILRQNPDVILIGEMRDLETIQSALRAAETGHLVFATLHTNDAVQAVDRVVDVFPAAQQQQIRFQMSMCLLAAISQRLLPRADSEGRILACEFLKNNTAVASLIREGKTHLLYGVMETASKEGMITLDQAVKNLYLDGLITYDEALNCVRDPKTISAL
ncbi:MAG TPA: type IV pilus twitching motility protein PilT [Candidatus Hydrogenedentes bacterium]|nr:type IV pilus twitching motility protein PilT [Candidatus Hydrogenedentota bacterium]